MILKDVIAVLHHDLGIEAGAEGTGHHRDLITDVATHPYLIIDQYDLPTPTVAEYPRFAKNHHNLIRLYSWRAILNAESFTIFAEGENVFEISYKKVPLDWMKAVRQWGGINVVAISEFPEDVDSFATNLEQYLDHDDSILFQIPVSVRPNSFRKTVEEYRTVLSASTILSTQPYTMPTYEKVYKPIETMRDLHEVGRLPADVGQLSFDGTVDAQGFFHEEYNCQYIAGEKKTSRNLFFNDAAHYACIYCGPHWDRKINTFREYSKLYKILSEESIPLNELFYLAEPNGNDPWFSANKAYQAMIRLRGTHSQITSSIASPAEAANKVAALSLLLESIDRTVETAARKAPSPALEYAIVVAVSPKIRTQIRNKISSISTLLVEPMVNRLLEGADIRLPVHLDYFANISNIDKIIIGKLSQQIFEYLSQLSPALVGDLVWVAATGIYVPADQATRLAAWWYGYINDMINDTSLVAMPRLIAESISKQAHDTVEIVSNVWQGETLEVAGDMLAGMKYPSVYKLREALEKYRTQNYQIDPSQPIGWRNFNNPEIVERRLL